MTSLDFINMLPEDCISTILSLTSPADACKSSIVSFLFQSAANSDIVWKKLLPSDYHNIVQRSVIQLKFSSRKDLFFSLCNPILIDGGNKCFKLEKSSGRKSFRLSARELSITLSNDPIHWSWKSIPESRFQEVAVLKTISQLEIQGKIRTKLLSPNTHYGAYLIIRISKTAFGLDFIPSEISVEVGKNMVYTNTAYISPKDSHKKQMESIFYSHRVEMFRERVNKGDGKLPQERDDGWMEIKLGNFFSGEFDEEVKMSLLEVKGGHLKGGLIIEGIEVRPK